jgi:quercetin dioxygenase-like cupin family protein
MKSNHSRLFSATALTALVPLVALGPAHSASSAGSTDAGSAKAAPPPVVELLSRGAIAKPFEAKAHGIEVEAKRRIDVATAHLTFAPGGSTGWHRHPGPTVVTVTAGELTTTDRFCKSKVYEAGQTFVEQGPRRHVAVNTADTTTQVIVTFFVPRGAKLLLTPASPPACAS